MTNNTPRWVFLLACTVIAGLLGGVYGFAGTKADRSEINQICVQLSDLKADIRELRQEVRQVDNKLDRLPGLVVDQHGP